MVLNALQKNPHEKFWQARFEEHETKTHIEVEFLLPRDLIPLLEEWIHIHRPILVHGEDPGTLLVNSKGRRISIHQMARTIGELTLRFAGRRVTPHVLRDIFSVAYLEDNPKDYLTLSKILWHRSPKMVIETYGANFDESYGVLATENWRERRKRKDK